MNSLAELRKSVDDIRAFRKQYEAGELCSSHDRGHQLERELQHQRHENIVLMAQLHRLELELAAEKHTNKTVLATNSDLQHALDQHTQADAQQRKLHKRAVLQLGERIAHRDRELAEARLALQRTSAVERDAQAVHKLVLQLQARVHELESTTLPACTEAKRAAEQEARALKLSLQETIESESMLRTLLLQEQSARQRRHREAAGEV